MNSNTENELLGLATRIGTRVVRSLYALVAVSVVAAFGVGVFFATTNQRLSNIEIQQKESRQLFQVYLTRTEIRLDVIENEHAVFRDRFFGRPQE